MSLDPHPSESSALAASATAYPDSPDAIRVRLMIVRDSMIKAAEQVNLLVDMGFSHTAGCREARQNYETRAQEYHTLLARLAAQAPKGV